MAAPDRGAPPERPSAGPALAAAEAGPCRLRLVPRALRLGAGCARRFTQAVGLLLGASRLALDLLGVVRQPARLGVELADATALGGRRLTLSPSRRRPRGAPTRARQGGDGVESGRRLIGAEPAVRQEAAALLVHGGRTK